MLYFRYIKKCLFENNAAAGRHLCYFYLCHREKDTSFCSKIQFLQKLEACEIKKAVGWFCYNLFLKERTEKTGLHGLRG